MADVKEPVDNQLPKKLEEKGKGKAEEKETHISQNLRILLIDDNDVFLSIMASQLTHCGFQVTSMKKASEALDLLRRNRDGFDTVLADVGRYDINGFKLLEIIGREFGIPVITASAMDDKKTVEESIRCGERDYLVKPEPVKILQDIRNHVIRRIPPVNPPAADAVSMEANNNNNKKITTLDGNSANPNKRSDDDDDDQKKKNVKVKYEYITSSSEESSTIEKKPRLVWDARLHQKFLDAVLGLGVDRAVPKKILEMMNEPGLTRENVASHLQKFRNIIRKEKERSAQKMGMNPRDATIVNPMIQRAVPGNQGLTLGRGSFLQRSLHSGEQLKNMAANSVHQNVAPCSSSSLATESRIVNKIMRCPPIDRNRRSIFDLEFVQTSPQLANTSSGLRHPTAGCLVIGNSINDNLPKLNRMNSNSDIVCNQVEHTESSQAGVSINGETKHHHLMSAVAGTSFGENSGVHLSSAPDSIVPIHVGDTQLSQVAGSVGGIKNDHFTHPISAGSSSDRGNNVVSHQVRPPRPSQHVGVSIGGIKCFGSDRENNSLVTYQAQPTQSSQAGDSNGGKFKHDHLTQHISAGSSDKGNNTAYSAPYQGRPMQPSQATGSLGGIKHDHLTQPVSTGISSDEGNNAHLSSYNNYAVTCEVRPTQYSQVAAVSIGGIKKNHFTQPVLAGGSSNRGNNGRLSSSNNCVVACQARPTHHSQTRGSVGGIRYDHLTKPFSVDISHRGNSGYLSSSDVVTHETMPTQPSQAGVFTGGIEEDADGSDRGNSAYCSSSNHVVSHEARPTKSEAICSIGENLNDHLLSTAGSSFRGNNSPVSSINSTFPYQVGPFQASSFVGGNNGQDWYTLPCSQMGGSSVGENNYDHLIQPLLAGNSGNNTGHLTQPYQATGSFVKENNNGHHGNPSLVATGENKGHNSSSLILLSLGENSSVTENKNCYCMQVLPTTDSSVNVGGNNNVQLSLPSGAAAGSFFVQGNNNAQAAEPIHDHSQSVVLTDNTCVAENTNGRDQMIPFPANSDIEIYSNNIESDIHDPPDEDISRLIKQMSNYDTPPMFFWRQ